MIQTLIGKTRFGVYEPLGNKTVRALLRPKSDNILSGLGLGYGIYFIYFSKYFYLLAKLLNNTNKEDIENFQSIFLTHQIFVSYFGSCQVRSVMSCQKVLLLANFFLKLNKSSN